MRATNPASFYWGQPEVSNTVKDPSYSMGARRHQHNNMTKEVIRNVLQFYTEV